MLYVIGDLHLSLTTDKKMDVFPGWEGYTERIREGFQILAPQDTCILCGDSSWGMSLEESLPDFRFLESLPGTKLLLKGNHDFWWTTAAKIGTFFSENGLQHLRILHNNAWEIDGKWICGTRGWLCGDPDAQDHDAKIMNRELMRLEASLIAAGDGEKLCFLHYPPKTRTGEFTQLIRLMSDYGVRRCWFGHIHRAGMQAAFQGKYMGIDFRLVSADTVGFLPQPIP